MSITSRTAAVLASGALALSVGLTGAPAALADGPNTPPGVKAEVEACAWPEYKKGDRAWQVSFARYLLSAYGYDPGGHGAHFDGKLEKALKKYQSKRDVPDTGRLDTETWAALRSGFGLAKEGDQGHKVRAVQKALQSYGYETRAASDPDGIFGPKTKKSVIAFQKKVGIDPDGIVGTITFRALVTGGTCHQLGLV